MFGQRRWLHCFLLLTCFAVLDSQIKRTETELFLDICKLHRRWYQKPCGRGYMHLTDALRAPWLPSLGRWLALWLPGACEVEARPVVCSGPPMHVIRAYVNCSLCQVQGTVKLIFGHRSVCTMA